MFEKNTIKLGIAPIGWTNDDMPELGRGNTFEQCISEIALAGFKGTEIGNKFPQKSDPLKKALDMRGIEIASAWFSSFLTTDSYEDTEKRFIEHRDFLFGMGAKVIVVSEQGHSIQGKKNKALFVEKPTFTESEWKMLTNGLNHLGQLAQDKNMKLVYHHHMGTGVQTTEEIEELLNRTDANKVFLLYDTGHLYLSGEDPLYIIEKYITRIKHIHLKDVRQAVAKDVNKQKSSFLDGVKAGMFTVPGDGDIDFLPIFQCIAKSNYTGWFVVEAEQDPEQANPFEYALIARKYIRDATAL